jgi:hypothetical protein
MLPFMPMGPTKKGEPSRDPRDAIIRRRADPLTSLFRPDGPQSPAKKPRERGARFADVKRALFFGAVLIFVGIVLYQFVSAL